MRLKKHTAALAVLAALSLGGCTPETEDKKDDNNSGGGAVEVPTISIEGARFVSEPVNGESAYAIKVNLTSAAKESIRVKYDITAITADSGKDFTASSGELEIKAGARSAEIHYTVKGDDLDEDDETFSIKLSNPTGATIRDGYDTGVITIRDEDKDSEVEFNTEFAQVAEGSGIYRIKVQLTTASEKDVKIPFTISGLATQGQDYNPVTTSPITVPAGASEVEIALDFLGDTIPEGGESVVVQLQTPKNASLGKKNKATLMIPGDVGLNDTGVTTWYDGMTYDSTASNSTYPGQDASYGRDAINQPAFDGHAGFSFTKLDAAGNALPSNESNFRCILDNRTGLIWEKKEEVQTLPNLSGDALKKHLDEHLKNDTYPYDMANFFWQATNYKYYWYNTNDATNGGADGAPGEIVPKTSHPINAECAFPNKNQVSYSSAFNRCNTEVYAKAMNELAICGFKDWRVPTIGELSSIHNHRATDPEPGEVDFFPNTMTGDYLTSTPSADGTGAVWCSSSNTGQVRLCNKQHVNYIRMVRGGSQ
ncbi:Calx-beta domain-containing protein [Vibrio alginolyticus]